MKMTNIFLYTEEKARKYFEQTPFIHSFLAGIGVVLFWRGVWEVADFYSLSPFISILIGILILGGIGLFVQTFIGNTIIIKNVKSDINLEKKTEKEIIKEEITLSHIAEKINILNSKIENIENKLK